MFSRRQILGPVLVIILLAWAAGGPTRSGPRAPKVAGLPQGPTAQSQAPVHGLRPGELPVPFDLAANDLHAAEPPGPPSLFLHPVHDPDGGFKVSRLPD